MKNLVTYFKCLFSDPRISAYRLVVFAADHLQRMIANNVAGKYDVQIAALTACLHDMHTESGDLSYDIIMQRTSTMSLDNLTKAIIKDLSKADATIILTYPDNNVVYLEFFPHGLTAWNTATREGMTAILSSFKKACNAHTAELSSAFIQKWNDYQSNYILAHNLQTTKKATVSSDRDALKQQRIKLEDQLMDDLYDIGKEYKRQTDKCHIFFNQSLLFLHHHHAVDKETYDGELMAMDTLVVTNEFDSTTLFRIKNNGDFPFTLCFSDSETDACLIGLVIDKGETKEITAHDLGADDKKNLKISNFNAEETCYYEIIKFITA